MAKNKHETTGVKGVRKTSQAAVKNTSPKKVYAIRGVTGEFKTHRKRAMQSSVKANDEFVEFDLQNVNRLPATDKIGLIKRGFSKEQLEGIKKESDLDYDTLSSLLSVSRATLLKKKGADKFDQSTSERIMLLADLIAYGQDVFEDKEQFNSWLKKPNKALGMKAPLEIMDTLYGIEEVKKELGRIEYGVF
jgi:putative toxin-antitoxin system antitoxin component (TIGR02293 family)